MSDMLPPVIAVLGSEVSGFTSGIGKVMSEMGKAEGMFGTLASVGGGAALAIGAAVAGVAAESIKMASNFNQAMELVHTQAGASQAEVEALKSKVLDLAPSVGIGPEKLAEGLYHVESAGFRGAQAMDILKAAAETAATGQSDLETTTQALIGTMAVGFRDVRNAADAGAYLNQIVGIGDMRMEKLSAAVATGVLPSFKSAGLGMKDFGAALATLTDNVTPADEAATRLRMTVSLLAAPSHAADKALHQIGLSGTQLATDMRKPNGLMVAVDDLKTHLEKSGKSAVEQNQIIQHAFGGGKTSGAILTLIEESDRLKSKYDALGTSASRAATQQDAWKNQQQQLSQQMKDLKAAAESLGIKLGEKLMPIVEEIIGDFKDFGKSLEKTFGRKDVKDAVDNLSHAFDHMSKDVLKDLKKDLKDLSKFIDDHHETISRLINFIANDVVPVLGFLGKFVIKGLIGDIEMAILIVQMWQAEFDAIRHFVVGIWIKSMVDAIMSFVGTLLEAADKAFGWVPGLGPKLDKAVKDFRHFRTSVDEQLNALDGRAVNVYVHGHVDGTNLIQSGDTFTAAGKAGVKFRAGGGPVDAFRPYWVGERGPELIVPNHDGFVLSRDMLASMRGSGPSVNGTAAVPGLAARAGVQVIEMHVHSHNYLDGKELHRGLIPAAQQYKIRTGTTGLS